MDKNEILSDEVYKKRSEVKALADKKADCENMVSGYLAEIQKINKQIDNETMLIAALENIINKSTEALA